ncbi:MAG: DUF1552 domain-containing protein [Acidobacteria bacterium]|nr:DUF1552 domain-containing protein [Acidobacteriota bacterium]
MMIFKKILPRRTFLRGLGAGVALPLLDSMVPAFASSPEALDAAGKSPVRMSFVYVPNGMIMDKWNPATRGAKYQASPILSPLDGFRDQYLVLSGLNGGPSLIGGHPRASAMWLTGVDPKKSAYDLQAGVSADQLAARELGKATPIESLELGVENPAELVGEASGYSAAYTNTISWRTPSQPLPMEHKPRVVFERLFGDGAGADPATRRARISEQKSILDLISREVSRLNSDLGPSDRSKLNEYLDSVRDVERRIDLARERPDRGAPAMQRPTGIPAKYEDHVKLMFDLQVLAFQSGMTHISTFMMAREKSDLVYSQLGQSEPHHAISHNRGDVQKINLKEQIDTYHAKLFAYYLGRLRATPDGDGTLLDHSLVLYGSGLSDGDLHTQRDLPLLLAGGAYGKLRGGRYVRYPDGMPLTNLLVSMLEIAGVPGEKLGDSSGRVDLTVAE